MTLPTHLHYTVEHEWLEDGSPATVGITSTAADALGDIVYLELPAVGEELTAGSVVGEIESTKSVSELFSPPSRDRRRGQPGRRRRPPLGGELGPVRGGGGVAAQGRRDRHGPAPHRRRVRGPVPGVTCVTIYIGCSGPCVSAGRVNVTRL